MEFIARFHGTIRAYLFDSRARGNNDYNFYAVTFGDCDLFKLDGFFTYLKDAIGVGST